MRVFCSRTRETVRVLFNLGFNALSWCTVSRFLSFNRQLDVLNSLLLLVLSTTLILYSTFSIPGGIAYPLFGSLAEYLVLSQDSVVPALEHMMDEEAGA